MDVRPFVLAFGLLLWGLGLPLHCAEIRRVALSSFTTDENVWESMQAASDLTHLVQAELGPEAGIEWVEREELGLAQREWEVMAAIGQQDVRGAIERARWQKADWLLTGHIVSQDGARVLLVEVIALAHADVLAERRYPLPIAADRPLRDALAHPQALAAALREALRDATKREQAVAGLPTVAVLFFPNLEVFQREFVAALSDPQISGGPLRLLRLPRAAEASDEAGLVLGGFAEDPQGAWNGIADIYAWGSLIQRETGSIDGDVIRDAHTPEITLNVWDGRLSPMRFVEEGEPIARREFDQAVTAQARRLAESLAERVRTRRTVPVDADQRRRISQSLLRAAQDMEDRQTHPEGYLSDPAGRRFFFNLVQTLEASCFFDPKNRAAQEALLRFRWGRPSEYDVNNRFRFQLSRSAAWGRFVDQFGFPEPGPSIQEQIRATMGATPVDDAKLRALMKKSSRPAQPVAKMFLDTAIEAVEAVGAARPRAVPEATVARWAEELTGEVGRRLLLAVDRKQSDLCRALATVLDSRGPKSFSLRDGRKRLAILEKVWAALTPDEQRRAATPGSEIREDIEWTFAELGNAGGEKRLFATAPPPIEKPAPATVRADSTAPSRHLPQRPKLPGPNRLIPESLHLFRMTPMAAPPPEIKPRIEKFEAPKKAGLFRVYDLALLAGKVWLIAEGLEHDEVAGTNRALAAELRPTSYQATRLFCFDPADQTIERVAATRQFKPVSMLPHDGKLWLGLGMEGVAVLDPARHEVRRFGTGDGLDVASAYRLAVAGGRVFATANTTDLQMWDADTARWSPRKNDFPGERPLYYGGELRRIAGRGSSLLLYQGAVGIFDVRSPGWTRHETQIPLDRLVNCISADAQGFWLGGRAGLSFLRPEIDETINRFLPENTRAWGDATSTAAVVDSFLRQRAQFQAKRQSGDGSHPLRPTNRLPGAVVAMVSDGDFLWLSTAQAGSVYGWTHLLLLHKPSNRWVAHFKTDNSTCLAVDDRYLWLGCSIGHGAGATCLQRLEKRALYETPEQKWTTDTVAESEITGWLDRLEARERALWYFAGGEAARAATLLASLETQTAETLFLQGLCHDETGLNQIEKSRAFFQQVIAAHSAHPLAAEALKRLASPPVAPPGAGSTGQREP